MPNGMSERSVLIEHCGVGGSARKDTLYPIPPRASVWMLALTASFLSHQSLTTLMPGILAV